MSGNLNQPPTTENNEKKNSKILLHFFRHSIKESDNVGSHDFGVKLSEEGRKLAKENSFNSKNLNQSVAFGSKRIRAQETTGFVMAGSKDDITGSESLEELKEKLNTNMKVGSKIGVDDRLNFNDSRDTPLGEKQYEAYDRGEYLKFIIEESDRVTKETGDKSKGNYSHKAAEIARIVGKYLKIGPNWNKLVADEGKGYTDTLERFMGTHQGMCESFLSKVIEKTDGLEERNNFMKAIGTQGFGYVEGFNTLIETINGIQHLKVSFNKETQDGKYTFEKVVPVHILQEIISEDQ